jgi:predicted PurR-regulated permease PerM
LTLCLLNSHQIYPKTAGITSALQPRSVIRAADAATASLPKPAHPGIESRPTTMPAFDLRTSARTARHNARIAGAALFNWWRAVCIEALCVALLWWLGLALLGVPLAPLWALIGGLMTFVPNFGGAITVIFPVLMILFSGRDEYRLGLVLGLYAAIVIIDQLLIQPILLKRVTRVPIWASILVPILLGIIIPFWGVLLGPPLLAVVYAFRKPRPKAGLPPPSSDPQLPA